MSFLSKMEDIYVFFDFGGRHAFGDIFYLRKRHMSFIVLWKIYILWSEMEDIYIFFHFGGRHSFGDIFYLGKRHMSFSVLWKMYFFVYRSYFFILPFVKRDVSFLFENSFFYKFHIMISNCLIVNRTLLLYIYHFIRF